MTQNSCEVLGTPLRVHRRRTVIGHYLSSEVRCRHNHSVLPSWRRSGSVRRFTDIRTESGTDVEVLSSTWSWGVSNHGNLTSESLSHSLSFINNKVQWQVPSLTVVMWQIYLYLKIYWIVMCVPLFTNLFPNRPLHGITTSPMETLHLSSPYLPPLF